MPQYQDLTLAVDGEVAVITLNRPEVLNAFTPAMGESLAAAFDAAAHDDGVRAIVLTGAGRGFCAGADMKMLQGIDPSKRPAEPTYPEPASRASPELDVSGVYGGRFGYFFSVPKPVIAAVNGPAAGLGLILALHADVRFASADARFTTSFSQRGLIAEHGIAWLLPRLIGPANALDLLVSARKFDGREAERLGLVTRALPAVEVLPAALDYARAIAQTVSPRSAAIMKAQIWKGLGQTFNESLKLANAEMLKSFSSDDFREGVAHFVEKRAPRFSGK